MKRLNLSLLSMVLVALVSCKGNDPETYEISGRLMTTTDQGIDDLRLELVEIQFYPNTNSTTEKVHDSYQTREGGKFRFTYEKSNLLIPGKTCNENNEGLYLRNAETNEYYFKCFPTNKDVYCLLYTKTNALLRLEIADTIGINDTFYFPYAPTDTSLGHSILLTDTFGNSYPYFYVAGPAQPQAFTFETKFNNHVYEGFYQNKHGEELFQWFIRGESAEHSSLETWRPRGLPYLDTITLKNLYR